MGGSLSNISFENDTPSSTPTSSSTPTTPTKNPMRLYNPINAVSTISSTIDSASYLPLHQQEEEFQKQQQQKSKRTNPFTTPNLEAMKLCYEELQTLQYLGVLEQRFISYCNYKKKVDGLHIAQSQQEFTEWVQPYMNARFIFSKFFDPYVLFQAADSNGNIPVCIYVSNNEIDSIWVKLASKFYEPAAGYVHMGLKIGGVYVTLLFYFTLYVNFCYCVVR